MMDGRKGRQKEYPYGNNDREENCIPGFYTSSDNEVDDDDDDEIMFLKDVFNNPTDGYEHYTADMNRLRSLLIEEDVGYRNRADLIKPSGVGSILVDEENAGTIGTFETAEQLDAKVSYVHNYERMIQQQELEHMATVEHLLPLFEGIRNLGNNGTNNTHVQTYLDSYLQNYGNDKQQASVRDLPILTYDQMKRALRTLEGSSFTNGPSLPQEIIQTDEQLLMTLRELVSISIRYHDDQRRMSLGLTFPEFLQCYRVVVNGMQILEMLPNSTVGATASETKNPNHIMDCSQNIRQSTQAWIPKLRTTTTSRVFAMIRTFTIPAEEVSNYSTTTYSNTIDTIIAAAELRNILTAKDQQLAQMITTHEEEIDELACQINQITMQYRRRSYAICALWILCVIATFVYASRGDIQPVVTECTSITITSNISTPISNNNQTLRQQQKDRLAVESIFNDLSNGVPIMNVQLEVLKESYGSAMQLLKQINKHFPNSTMFHPQGSLDGASANATDMEWFQLQQTDTSIRNINSTPPLTSNGSIHKTFTSKRQINRSKEENVLEQRLNPAFTPVLLRILKSNLPYISATSVFGLLVTGIAIYQPGVTVFFQNLFRIFFRF